MKNVLIIGCSYLKLPATIGEYKITQIGLVKETKSIFYKLLRFIALRTNILNLKKFFLIDEISNLVNEYDVVILFDSSTKEVLEMLVNSIENSICTSEIILKFYYWNSVNESNLVSLSSKWQVYTYDKRMAVNFHQKYIGSFYNPVYINQIVTNKSDLFFVGINKGRFQFIRKLENRLRNANMRPIFLYVSPIKSIFNKNYCKPIPYDSVIRYIYSTGAILDITKAGQFGITLRVLEGIFYDKKVVTTHKYIKNYCFYDPGKILIVDECIDVDVIKEFLRKEFTPYSDDIKKMYDFKSWLGRILLDDVSFNDSVI